MKNFCALFLCLLSFQAVDAQDYSKAKWGKVSYDDLEMTVYDADSSAEAVVLYHFGETSFKFLSDRVQFEYDRHTRIKILSEEGFKHADITIPYWSHNKEENVKSLKAQVMNPDGSKYVLSKDEIFKEKVNDYVTAYKFSFPKLQVGSVIEYKYNLLSKRFTTIRDWEFQFDIPVRYALLEFDVPKEAEYVDIMTNGHLVDVDNKKYIAKDVPAMKEEPFITTMDDYRGHIKFQLRGIRVSASDYIPVLSTWEKVADVLLDASNFGDQFLKKGNYKRILRDAQSIVATEMPVREKAEALAAFLLSRVKWDGSHDVYAYKSIHDMYEDGVASGSGLNMMLLALLREAGVAAHPVLVSTRDHGRVFPLYPFVNQFNHCIVYFKDGQEEVFADITTADKPACMPSEHALNGHAWLVHRVKPTWMTINPPVGSDVFYGEFAINDEGALEGNIRGRYSGHNAIPERKAYRKDATGKHWQERLTGRFPDATVENVEAVNPESVTTPFKDMYTCTLPSAVVDGGDYLYVNPIIYSSFADNPLRQPERDYPVDFAHPFREQFVFNLTIPEGYVVEALPDQTLIAVPDKTATFQLNAKEANGRIQMIRTLDIRKTRYNPEEYEALRSLFELMMEKMEENIVLKKM